MELTQKDTSMAQGVAILFMVAGHLFAKVGPDVYGTPLIWVKDGIPLVYYAGFMGGICLPFFCMCTGYALYTQFTAMEKRAFQKRNKKRVFNFLTHFWTVCLIFTAVSLFVRSSEGMPGGVLKFLGNFFLLEQTYNGAWWFASTYVIFLLLSPLYLAFIKKMDSRIAFAGFALVFCAYYLCNMKWRFIDIEPYYWKGLLIRKITDLWYVSFFYVEGMLFAKERVTSRIRNWAKQHRLTNRLLAIIVLAAALATCVIRVSALVYFAATFFFICFHLWKKSERCERFFLFWGKHSTNIWLVHMFFYLTLFPDLVFVVNYPVLIYCFMMALSLISSWIIGVICKPVERCLQKFERRLNQRTENRVI